MPYLVLASVLAVAALLVRRAFVRLREELDRTTKRALREYERAEDLRRELLAERQRAAPASRSESVETLIAASDLGICGTPDEVAVRIGRAVAEALDPAQWMVLLAANDACTEFVIGASGAKDGEAVWPAGGRVDSQCGRVGLAVRRRGAMDLADFAGQPQVIREQVDRTEPRAFRVDVAAPAVVDGRVVAVLTAGGSARPLGETRAALEAFARATAQALGVVAAEPAM